MAILRGGHGGHDPCESSGLPPYKIGYNVARLHNCWIHSVASHNWCQITPLTQSCIFMLSGIQPPLQYWCGYPAGHPKLLQIETPLLPFLSDRVKPSFVIFDIRALWRSGLSGRVPGCRKFKWSRPPMLLALCYLFNATGWCTSKLLSVSFTCLMV